MRGTRSARAAQVRPPAGRSTSRSPGRRACCRCWPSPRRSSCARGERCRRGQRGGCFCRAAHPRGEAGGPRHTLHSIIPQYHVLFLSSTTQVLFFSAIIYYFKAGDRFSVIKYYFKARDRERDREGLPPAAQHDCVHGGVLHGSNR